MPININRKQKTMRDSAFVNSMERTGVTKSCMSGQLSRHSVIAVAPAQIVTAEGGCGSLEDGHPVVP